MPEFLISEWPYVIFTVFGSILLTIPLTGKAGDDGGACLSMIFIISVTLLFTKPTYAGIFLIIPCLFTLIAFIVFVVRDDDADKEDTKAKKMDEEVASLRSEISRLAEAMEGQAEHR